MTTIRCTASNEERTWDREAWIAGEGYCPDCGALVEVRVRATDLAPRAKAKAHKAPEGVTPQPYGVHPASGQPVAR